MNRCKVTRAMANGVQTLIETLYVKCTDGETGICYVKTIAKKWVGGEISPRSVQRYICWAKEVGILSVEFRFSDRKRPGREIGWQRASEFKIQWSQIDALVASIPPARPHDSLSRPHDSLSCPHDSLSPLTVGTYLGTVLEEGEGFLVSLGLRDWRGCCAQALARDVPPAEILIIARQYAENRDRWSTDLPSDSGNAARGNPAVLWFRIANHIPGHGVESFDPADWPPASSSWLSSQRTKRDAEESQAAAAAESQRQFDSEAEAARLESVCGHLLDSMPTGDRERFAARVLGEFLFSRWRRDPLPYREILLSSLENENATVRG